MRLRKKKIKKLKGHLKESLLKSIIYRIITITLGILVAYIVTGSIIAALSLGLVTEAVQFVNYFFYESTWTYYHDKRLKRKIKMEREVDVRLDFDLIKEISYEFSQTDTFIKELYHSIIGLFDKLLENKHLEDIHEHISNDKNFFEIKHRKRNLE